MLNILKTKGQSALWGLMSWQKGAPQFYSFDFELLQQMLNQFWELFIRQPNCDVEHDLSQTKLGQNDFSFHADQTNQASQLPKSRISNTGDMEKRNNCPADMSGSALNDTHLCSGIGSDFRTATHIHCLIDVLIHFPHCMKKVTGQNPLQCLQLGRWEITTYTDNSLATVMQADHKNSTHTHTRREKTKQSQKLKSNQYI